MMPDAGDAGPADGGQPARRARQAETPDRPAADARARRVGADSPGPASASISERWPLRRRAGGAGRAGERPRPDGATRRRTSRSAATRNGWSGCS
jgi:hypothetical protein